MRRATVYLLPLGEEERQGLSALSPGELARMGVDRENWERLSQKRSPHAYEQSLAVHLLCLFGLRERCRGELPPISRTPQGQPVTLGGGAFLSCTHTRGMAAAAVSPVAVGIDLEDTRPANLRVARRMFAPEEQAALERSPDPDRDFTRLWTLREAYGKLLGCGLAGLPPVEFVPDRTGWHSGLGAWVYRWEGEGRILSVLLQGEDMACDVTPLGLGELTGGLAG